MTVTDPAPRLDLTTLPDGVTTTFTHWCAYGCLVRTVEGQEQPHVCVGEQLVAALAGDDVTWQVCQRITEGLKPLMRQLKGWSWEDGIRAGRRGLVYGVDGPDDREAAEGLAHELEETLAGLAIQRDEAARS